MADTQNNSSSSQQQQQPEKFKELLKTPLPPQTTPGSAIVVEQIESPPNFVGDEVYDQKHSEVVAVISGSAILIFDEDVKKSSENSSEKEKEERNEKKELRPGDVLHIPAYRRHRVLHTNTNEPTIWLATHLPEATPSLLVPLDSPRGKVLKESAKEKGGLVCESLIDVFAKQVGNTTCGLASLAMVGRSLQALNNNNNNNNTTSPSEDDLYKNIDENKLNNPNLPQEADVRQKGINLDELAAMAQEALSIPPTKTQLFRPGLGQQHNNAPTTQLLASMSDLRELLKRGLGKKNEENGDCCRILLNYSMSTLGQEYDYGHISPIAAFDLDSDSALILDVWYESTPIWAPLSRIWDAVRAVDSDTQRARGLVVCHFGVGE